MTQPREPERLPLPSRRLGAGATSSRRVEGPTAHGGAYAIIIERPVRGETHVEIVEFDENDHPIFRTYGRLEKREDERTSG